MNGLVELRADVAGRVRARLDTAGRTEAVVLDVRDAHPPCVIVGIPTLAYIDGQVTVPVSMLAPGPGSGDALEWLQGVLEVVTGGGPLGPYRFVTADPVAVDVGDRSFPAYQVACAIPAPKTFCGNRLPGVRPPTPRLDLDVVDVDDLTVTVTVTNVDGDPGADRVMVDWDDGTATANLVHTYTDAGTYTLVATQDGRLDSPPVEVTVGEPEPLPQLVLTVVDTDDLTVTVDITNEDPTGPTASVVWGDSYETTAPTHTYDDAGTYTLFARQQGRLPSPPVDVTVTEPPPPPVQLVLTVTDQTDLTVTVDVTNDDTELPVSIDWDDGTINTATAHTYAAAGTYTLIAEQVGRIDSAPVDVTVTEPPPPVGLLDQVTPAYYGFTGSSYTLNTTYAGATSHLAVFYGPGKTPLPTLSADAGSDLTPAVVGLTWAEMAAEGATQASVTSPFVKSGPPATWTAAGNPVPWLYFNDFATVGATTFAAALLDAGGATVHTYDPIPLTPAGAET